MTGLIGLVRGDLDFLEVSGSPAATSSSSVVSAEFQATSSIVTFFICDRNPGLGFLPFGAVLRVAIPPLAPNVMKQVPRLALGGGEKGTWVCENTKTMAHSHSTFMQGVIYLQCQ